MVAKEPRPLISVPEADFSLSLWSIELVGAGGGTCHSVA